MSSRRRVRGWQTYPVDVQTKGDTQITGISGLAIVEGPATGLEAKPVILDPPMARDGGANRAKPSVCTFRHRNPEDGGDLFLLDQTGFIT